MTGRMLIIRDLQVAQDIKERSKLGWFEQEFDYFAVSYYHDSEQYYLLSSDAKRVYDFAEQSLLDNIYCTPIQSYRKKCPVPSGTEELIAKDLKVTFAKELQKTFSADFFREFSEIFSERENDGAKNILDAWQDMVAGSFDAEILDLFQMLLEEAYRAKVLKSYSYRQYRDFLTEMYEDMGDELLVKDIFKRDFYSMIYKDGEKEHTIINAQKDRLYAKRDELWLKGVQTTPIYQKTYWYNHDYRLIDARKDYEQHLNTPLIRKFISSAQLINDLPTSIAKDEYDSYIMDFTMRYGMGIKPYLDMYRIRWHIK